MVQDNSTKIVFGIVLLIAVLGVVFAVRHGYQYKQAHTERPGLLGGKECCSCSRAQQTLDGAVRSDTREVLFSNVIVQDCASACAQAHEFTKMPRIRYDVNSYVSDDSACKVSLPEPLAYQGAGGMGGFADQPMQDQYYVS